MRPVSTFFDIQLSNSREHVEKSRSKSRPVGSQYIASLFTNFVELHGDRYFGDDKAILGGIALATSDELIAKRYARFRKM